MTGSQFVALYRDNGLHAWEGAALELARRGGDGLVDHPFVEIPLADDAGNTAVVRVRSDVLAVGTPEDSVRLPLTPTAAQGILNLTGELLPTPWLAYQIWRSAQLKLAPTPMVPNKGANLDQYAEHSRIIDAQIASAAEGGVPLVAGGTSVAGIKKHVVVSNIYQPGKVLIFGWYRPSPPFPDVFDDRTAQTNPQRQPIQPLSNIHGEFYVDYSHGIQGVHPEALVNGQVMSTEELYQHSTLSKLVSREGPVRTPRYPSKVPIARHRPVSSLVRPAAITVVPNLPAAADLGFAMLTRR